jgi:hypothetical protein
MNRRPGIWCAIAFLGLTALGQAAESLRIVPLVSDDEVVVSFELADAYTADIREAISSGLRATFTYDVELRMVGAFWVDRTVATLAISTSDQFDNLTRRHSLLRTVDGRVADTLVTEDESVVGKWLTTFVRLPLCQTSKLDAKRDYYVRIRARSRPHGDSLLGWANAITGQTKFTFIR